MKKIAFITTNGAKFEEVSRILGQTISRTNAEERGIIKGSPSKVGSPTEDSARWLGRDDKLRFDF